MIFYDRKQGKLVVPKVSVSAYIFEVAWSINIRKSPMRVKHKFCMKKTLKRKKKADDRFKPAIRFFIWMDDIRCVRSVQPSHLMSRR